MKIVIIKLEVIDSVHFPQKESDKFDVVRIKNFPHVISDKEVVNFLKKSRKSGDMTSPFPDLKLFFVNIWLTIILTIIFTLKLPIILTFLIVFSCCRVLTKSQI